MSTLLDDLPRTLDAAEQAVSDSVARGPARFDLTREQRQAWADRHRALIARREALRAAAPLPQRPPNPGQHDRPTPQPQPGLPHPQH